MRNGGHVVAGAIEALKISRVYCVAGESYLPILDGLLDVPSVDVVTCRQESGVTFMAEAYGALHNAPAVAMVTRGPGACNASIGVHTAMQSSTPMIVLVGLIHTQNRDKEAFQEFDVPSMFGSLCKLAGVVDAPERLTEYIARAHHVATSGRPGPVVLGLPENVLFPVCDAGALSSVPSQVRAPVSSDIKNMTGILAQAERPLVLVGGSGWSDAACEDLASFVSAAHLPVVTSFRRQDVFDHRHGCYIGELGTGANPALIERVKNADVILVINARLNEICTQEYSLFTENQSVLHIYPDAGVFGKTCVPDLAIESHVGPAVSALAGQGRLDGRQWAAWRDDGRAEYLSWSDAHKAAAVGGLRGADMNEVFAFLQDTLPKDAIVTTDAGNFSGWAQRYLRYGRPGRLLAPISGAMGYAVPSAVAAALEYPDRLTLGVCGDGGFMMSAQEMATAIHYNAKPVILVCNNNMYGTIRMHQNKHYPGRVSATGLTNPDFVQMAKSYGAFAARAEDAAAFPAIWRDAVESDTLALIEIAMDPAQITTQSNR